MLFHPFLEEHDDSSGEATCGILPSLQRTIRLFDFSQAMGSSQSWENSLLPVLPSGNIVSVHYIDELL
jgi:hypothetical protein